MTNIYSSKGSKVIKNEDNIYTLESSNSLFLSYLTNVMPNISKRNPSSIVFQSKSVMTLSQQLAHHKHGLSYEAVDGIMRQIIKQIKFFEQNQFGLLFVSPEDIIVISNDIYVIANMDAFKRENNGILVVDTPYKKDNFKSPEFHSIRSLPYRVSYKSGYYSVACVGVYCLFKVNIHDKSDIDEMLLPILQTSLYWFLKRALNKNLKERFLILI